MEPERPQRSAPSVDQFLVLIVDDDEPITDTLAYIVMEAGYTAEVALRGQQALALASVHWPALLITDLMMPQMTGAQLIVALRTAAATLDLPAPPCVLTTAAGAHAIQAANADAVLLKPFSIDEVEAILHRFLPPPPDGGSAGRGA
ncbi:MAG TPA: response regulator [Ktedonobacterales bacterium]|nr:response regulator [Ktedonobacterales bacterium]